jgi:acyl-CoA reductase-like NAD-dependent aldehyde dehydrogenase
MPASDPEMTPPGANAIRARPSGTGHPPGEGLEVRSPADGSVIASVGDQSAEHVRAAVGRLRGSQAAWEALGPTGRGAWLGRLRDWLFDNDERVAELLQRETGKPWQEATLEVPFAIDLLEYYRKRAEKFLADSHPRPHNLLTATKRLTVR